MIIAEALKNSFGQTLMPAGTLIKANHIKILRTWNIRLVKIKSDENEENIKINKEIIAIAKQKISERLTWEPTTTEENQLIQIGVFQEAIQLSQNQ